MSTQPQVTNTAAKGGLIRKAGLMLVLAVALLPFGVPRWFAGGGHTSGSHPAVDVSQLCRDHGGTPGRAPGSGTSGTAQGFCTVRYGGQVYVMDAITPAGFDADTARYQRQGCGDARRTAKAAGSRRVFIYHPDTGVCEHRP
jgi:hypothetical protein